MSSKAQSGRADEKQVLVVEDNYSSRQVAVLMLEKLGCRVVAVSNGKEAVSLLQTSSFDAVFMDCQMPLLNGIDATVEIRKHEERSDKHVPIIAFTAQAMKGDEEKCLVAGMDGYISKPATFKDFKQALDKFVLI